MVLDFSHFQPAHNRMYLDNPSLETAAGLPFLSGGYKLQLEKGNLSSGSGIPAFLGPMWWPEAEIETL